VASFEVFPTYFILENILWHRLRWIGLYTILSESHSQLGGWPLLQCLRPANTTASTIPSSLSPRTTPPTSPYNKHQSTTTHHPTPSTRPASNYIPSTLPLFTLPPIFISRSIYLLSVLHLGTNPPSSKWYLYIRSSDDYCAPFNTDPQIPSNQTTKCYQW